jgi:hypothetical protein
MTDFLNQIIGILIGQAVVGTLALIGFVAILRRFLNTEFPAHMQGVNARLDNIHKDLENLVRDFGVMRRDVDRHEHRLEDTRDRLMLLERRKPLSLEKE